ncbi:MAG: recombination-associated protein RdgC [Desulfuromonadales bacterium]|nr:recombination-associated protein RdgC [Desulfuromonadales bacterium]MDT8423245.1 recombination-associated protein RdgC [Desulfuromonadales bacterium]
MGLLSNTTSLCQFHIVGTPPTDDFFTWAGARLTAQGFRSIDDCADELSMGWVQLDDTRDSTFEVRDTFQRDHYLTFTLRRDQRRVPAALLRAHFEQAQREFLTAHPGLQRVPKQKKADLREAVFAKLLARTLPAPACYDVLWDTRNGVVTFANLGGKMVDTFVELFKKTFDGLRLVAIHPYARAESLLDAPLQHALRAANGSGATTELDLIREYHWLGADFLLWLMYQTMNESSSYAVCRPGPATVGEGFVAYLNDRLQLVGGGEAGAQKVTVAGPQDSFREVCVALQSGKQMAEALLYFEKGEHQWKLTLKGTLFQFASFKAPSVRLERDNLTDPDSEREALFYERMHVMEEGLQLFDSLYRIFLELRLGTSWAAVRQRIDAWLAAA